jgi:hypothetical protein
MGKSRHLEKTKDIAVAKFKLAKVDEYVEKMRTRVNFLAT